VQTLPVPAFLIVLCSWAVGSFVGPFVARRTAPEHSAIPGGFVWAFFTIATIATLAVIPHPWWMWPAGILACVIFGVLGLASAGPSEYLVATSRTIHAPAEKVFRTLAHVENFSKAVPGIQKIQFLSDHKTGVGTRFRETRLMNGREASTVLEVTEYVENRHVRMVSDAGGTIWDTAFTVDPQNDAVLMTMQMTARPHNLAARLLTPMILNMVTTAVESDMDAVREYCEA